MARLSIDPLRELLLRSGGIFNAEQGMYKFLGARYSSCPPLSHRFLRNGTALRPALRLTVTCAPPWISVDPPMEASHFTAAAVPSSLLQRDPVLRLEF